MGETVRMNEAPLNDSAPVELTAKILMTAAVVLFLVVIFVLVLHFYAKWFWARVEESPASTSGQQSGALRRRHHRRRRHFVFAAVANDPALKGLDPAVLRSLPAVIFRPDESGEGLECAICLSELSDGEKARLLPKCNHGFHSDCIDMWFESHSTCPICRNPVGGDLPKPVGTDAEDVSSSTSSTNGDTELEEDNLSNGQSSESPNFPTNVLFWGNETQVSSRTVEEAPSLATPSSTDANAGTIGSSSSWVEGMHVINIPRPMENSSSRFTEEEPKSPMTTRLRSLKRLLSREKRINTCSSSSVDAEQV